MCIAPLTIRNPKYKKNKKNEGCVPTPIDERLEWIDVPCGKCLECRRKKQSEWRLRITEELRNEHQAIFVTLTFTNEKLEEYAKAGKKDNEIAKEAVKAWRERIRKATGKTPRYWMITEKGEQTNRIHIHGIIWKNTEIGHVGKIMQSWTEGATWVGHYVNERTVGYIVKYMTKTDKDGFKGIVLCSNGIGSGYVTRETKKLHKYKGEKTMTKITTKGGVRVELTEGWKRKIYTEEERERLRIDRMNKGRVYVGGREFETNSTKGYREYMKAVAERKEEVNQLEASIRISDRNNLAIQEKEPTFAHRNLPNWEDVKF